MHRYREATTTLGYWEGGKSIKFGLKQRSERRKISLLAFDLDGTLLNSSSEISAFNLSRIKDAVKRGVKITTCSGRIPAFQNMYLTQLNIQGPYVAINGALIPNGQCGELYAKPLHRSELAELCSFLNERRLHGCVQTKDKLYFTPENPRTRLVEQYNSLAVGKGLPKAPMGELATIMDNVDAIVYKAMIYTTCQSDLNMVSSFLDGQSGVAYTFSEPGLFDIMTRGVNKGLAIRKVADYYDIPYEEICAFGDFDNDVPLFEVAGTSVAMGNAKQELKDAATFITDSNDNDGVGKALEFLEQYFV